MVCVDSVSKCVTYLVFKPVVLHQRQGGFYELPIKGVPAAAGHIPLRFDAAFCDVYMYFIYGLARGMVGVLVSRKGGLYYGAATYAGLNQPCSHWRFRILASRSGPVAPGRAGLDPMRSRPVVLVVWWAVVARLVLVAPSPQTTVWCIGEMALKVGKATATWEWGYGVVCEHHVTYRRHCGHCGLVLVPRLNQHGGVVGLEVIRRVFRYHHLFGE